MSDFIALLNNTLSIYLRDLEMMVNTDCGTYSKAGVDTIAQRMRERMREFGAQVIDFPQDKYGDMLYGYWRGKGTARIVLIGHMDTVYSDGTVKQFSFRRLAGHALGPGVNDMKAGLLSGLYALNAVIQSGFDQFAEIGLFCNSDEEIGSPISRQIYPQYACGADAAREFVGCRRCGVGEND